MDPDGQHMWILDRCGANGCAESDLDPIIRIDLDGKLVKSFGKGLINFPHGFFIDREGNVWVTDGAPAGDARGAAGFKKGMGHQVFKFSPDGKVLMTLGEAGVAGADEKHFNGPTGVVVAAERRHLDHGRPRRPAGGTEQREHVRIARRQQPPGAVLEGRQVHQGMGRRRRLRERGPLQLQRSARHRDRRGGRLYIADRGNQRIQVLDKEGNFITRWTQFGKPSAIAIDGKGNIYVADGMSNAHWNPGWERGIRIGDLKTGWIKAFIPDMEIPAAPARSSWASTQGARSTRARAAVPASSFTSSSGRWISEMNPLSPAVAL